MDTVTRDDLIETVRIIMAALTTPDRTGLLDRQVTILEQLTARVEVLELEVQHQREAPPSSGVD